jgi:hypothetical protein
VGASLKDVARLAGVSVKTVSNVVNEYQHVSEATRSRVQEAIDQLGYRPNLTARHLRYGPSPWRVALPGTPNVGPRPTTPASRAPGLTQCGSPAHHPASPAQRHTDRRPRQVPSAAPNVTTTPPTYRDTARHPG